MMTTTKPLMWGNMPFNGISALSQEWDGNAKKSYQKLIENAIVVQPANGYKSSKGSAMFDGDLHTFKFSYGLFKDNVFICQVTSDVIGTSINFETRSTDTDLKTWIDNGNVLVIDCNGNADLSLLSQIYSDYEIFGSITFKVNDTNVDGNVDYKAEIDELRDVIENGEFDEDYKKSIDFIPLTQSVIDNTIRPYLSSFSGGIKLKTKDELLAILEKIKFPTKEEKEKAKSSKRSGYGGSGSTVNVYQNETISSKLIGVFNSLAISVDNDKPSLVELVKFSNKSSLNSSLVDLAFSLFGFESSLAYLSDCVDNLPTDIVNDDSVDQEKLVDTIIDNLKQLEMSELQQATSDLIKEKLGSLRGKLPKEWELDPKVNDDKWCSTISHILNQYDLSDINIVRQIKLIMSDDAKSSLVLYSTEQLDRIVKEMA